jgi:hypothetical protein
MKEYILSNLDQTNFQNLNHILNGLKFSNILLSDFQEILKEYKNFIFKEYVGINKQLDKDKIDEIFKFFMDSLKKITNLKHKNKYEAEKYVELIKFLNEIFSENKSNNSLIIMFNKNMKSIISLLILEGLKVYCEKESMITYSQIKNYEKNENVDSQYNNIKIKKIINEFLQVLNIVNNDETRNTITGFIMDNPKLSIYFLEMGSKSITNLNSLTIISEISIITYFKNHEDSWSKLKSSFIIPELKTSRDELVKYSKENGSLFTLYLYILKKYEGLKLKEVTTIEMEDENIEKYLSFESEVFDIIMDSKIKIESPFNIIPFWILYINLTLKIKKYEKKEWENTIKFVQYLLEKGGEKSGVLNKIFSVFTKNLPIEFVYPSRLIGIYLYSKIYNWSQDENSAEKEVNGLINNLKKESSKLTEKDFHLIPLVLTLDYINDNNFDYQSVLDLMMKLLKLYYKNNIFYVDI